MGSRRNVDIDVAVVSAIFYLCETSDEEERAPRYSPNLTPSIKRSESITFLPVSYKHTAMQYACIGQPVYAGLGLNKQQPR